jgi:IS30 family transposase
MSRKKRRWYTAAERSEMWDRWQRGESLNAIARAFETSHSAISKNFDRFGGIRPPDLQRSRLALTLSEREEISRGVVSGLSLRTIARQLDRAPSTISREINRNGGLKRYRANQADKAAWDRAHRPKPCKLAGSLQLRRIVASKLKRRWSPEQIAGWLKKVHANNEKLQVSHETIYRSLFIQARGVLKGQGLGQITDAVSIRERPPSAEDRAVPGHWEGDLICGSKNSFIATLVERQTRYVMLAKVSGKDTEAVISALIKQARKLPVELYKSLTWDRGSEMADHKRFTLDTNIQVYFCDPKSPWQRGSNENTNRLLRQYLPQGTDLSVHSQAKLDAIARQLNERPRKTLGYETPAERFNECVASTG